MKLGGRRAGHLTLFLDAESNEVVLRIQVDEAGRSLIAFKLFDAEGQLVEEAPEPKLYPTGVCVKSARGEVLLDIPVDAADSISYRLYSPKGQLLTFSDGQRTQIFPGLRMDGKSVAPARVKQGA